MPIPKNNPNLQVEIYLLENNEKIKTKISLLSLAVLMRDFDWVKKLLLQDFDSNLQDSYFQRTALHWAMANPVQFTYENHQFECLDAQPDLAWILLEHQINPNLKDRFNHLYLDLLPEWELSKWNFRIHQKQTYKFN